jgi:hypothetical protein
VDVGEDGSRSRMVVWMRWGGVTVRKNTKDFADPDCSQWAVLVPRASLGGDEFRLSLWEFGEMELFLRGGKSELNWR